MQPLHGAMLHRPESDAGSDMADMYMHTEVVLDAKSRSLPCPAINIHLSSY